MAAGGMRGLVGEQVETNHSTVKSKNREARTEQLFETRDLKNAKFLLSLLASRIIVMYL